MAGTSDAPTHHPAAAASWLDRVSAPPQWRVVDFISDLHLHAGDAATFAAWQNYLLQTTAQAVFILGDLFEVWVGDDMLYGDAEPAQADDDFARACADVLQHAGTRHAQFFMCGNRDFLIGDAMLRRCAMQGLADPCVLEFAGAHWLLSHGDALCLQDTEYQQFRRMVRSVPWQTEFLAQPLAQRLAIARQLRTQSANHQRAHPVASVVDTDATMAWLRDANARTLIHGHTHQPADHALADGHRRLVLSDWDLQAATPRADVLRLSRPDGDGPATVQRLALAQAC